MCRHQAGHMVDGRNISERRRQTRGIRDVAENDLDTVGQIAQSARATNQHPDAPARCEQVIHQMTSDEAIGTRDKDCSLVYHDRQH